MRSRAVTILAVLGVLGAGSAAMAVNADTFASGPKPIGSSSNVLVPAADESPAPGLGDDAKGTSGDSSTGQTKTPTPGVSPPKQSSPEPSADNGSGTTPTTNNGSDDAQSDRSHDQEDD